MSHHFALDPELSNLIWQIPCLVGECLVPYEHWTVEHECRDCKQLGHGHLECQQPEALRILRILIELQFNPKKKTTLLANRKSAYEIRQHLDLIPPEQRKKSSILRKLKISKPRFFQRKGYVKL